MQISVIIPTHNRAPLLGRAIESILSQTYKPVEIIVVDDGSTDSTSSLVPEQFPTCRYLHQENRGVSSARNRGIEAATGEWLAFLDSDDEWLPAKLARQKEALEAASTIKLCHTEEIWIRNGRRVNPMKKHAKSGGYIFEKCLPLCAISPSSVIIHRSIFDEIGLFDETLPACEDYDLWLRICSRYPVAFIEAPQIVKYGGHDDQLSRRHWGMDRFRIRALEKLITAPGLNKENRTAAVETLIYKAAIVAQGAEKRGNQDLATEYRAIERHYADLLPSPITDVHLSSTGRQ